MSKIDYRKLQALESEIVNSLQKNPPSENKIDSIEGFDFSLLLQRIKSDMREIRLQLISQIPPDKSKSLKPEPKPVNNINNVVAPADSTNATSSQASILTEFSSKQTQSAEKTQSANYLPQQDVNPAKEFTAITIAESLRISKIAKNEIKPKLTTKTQITRIIAHNRDSGIVAFVISYFKSPWIIFSAAIVSLVVAIFMINIFSDDSDPKALIPGNTSISNEIAAKKIKSSYPSAEKQSKRAIEAYEKGRQEMQKGNPHAAREYFRLALSITPGEKILLQALKESDEQVFKHINE